VDCERKLFGEGRRFCGEIGRFMQVQPRFRVRPSVSCGCSGTASFVEEIMIDVVRELYPEAMGLSPKVECRLRIAKFHGPPFYALEPICAFTAAACASSSVFKVICKACILPSGGVISSFKRSYISLCRAGNFYGQFNDPTHCQTFPANADDTTVILIINQILSEAHLK